MKRMLLRLSLLLSYSFLICLSTSAQTTITGTVTDAQALSISGVTVTVKGTQTAVQTDDKGKYVYIVEKDSKGRFVAVKKPVVVGESYGDKIEISLNIEGDIKDKYIAPLLILPFLENAFKHGTSDQLEMPWLSMDLAVKQNILRCKIANSKNNYVPFSASGIGIQNVRKRLNFIYPDRHELKTSDEGDFFVVSLQIALISREIKYHVESPAEVSPALNLLS